MNELNKLFSLMTKYVENVSKEKNDEKLFECLCKYFTKYMNQK